LSIIGTLTFGRRVDFCPVYYDNNAKFGRGTVNTGVKPVKDHDIELNTHARRPEAFMIIAHSCQLLTEAQRRDLRSALIEVITRWPGGTHKKLLVIPSRR
jgi:hypothetical protein